MDDGSRDPWLDEQARREDAIRVLQDRGLEVVHADHGGVIVVRRSTPAPGLPALLAVTAMLAASDTEPLELQHRDRGGQPLRGHAKSQAAGQLAVAQQERERRRRREARKAREAAQLRDGKPDRVRKAQNLARKAGR